MKIILEELTKSDIYIHILTSLKNVITGFVLAYIVALVLVLIMNEVKILDKVMYPIIEMLRPIPNAGWVPIAILISTTLEQSIIFITFVGAVFPIFLTLYRAIKTVPTQYENLAKLNKLSKLERYIHIIMPAILPQLFTAAMLGISGGWLSVIMAEMISGKSGIGYFTWKNYTLLNYQLVILGVVIMGFLGGLMSLIFSRLSKKITFWERKQDGK